MESYEEMADRTLAEDSPKLRVVKIGIADFLQQKFPPRIKILDPWLPIQGLGMVYASRGIGKTFFALSVGVAVASGGRFLTWKAPSPAGVIYLDGEMPAATMQERLASIITSTGMEPTAPLDIITPDLQPEGMMLRLDTEYGQQALNDVLTDDHKLIIVDNISTLCGAKENDADGWTPVQQWALRMRASGRSVLFIHHSGKGGNQRGTSRREDVLNTVIALRRPADYDPSSGAVFEVHFEKGRGIHGDDVKPIEAKLSTNNGLLEWQCRDVEASTFEKTVALANEGLSQSDIAEELSVNKSTICRHFKRAKDEGLLIKGGKNG